jgi:hypothetical protein
MGGDTGDAVLGRDAADPELPGGTVNAAAAGTKGAGFHGFGQGLVHGGFLLWKKLALYAVLYNNPPLFSSYFVIFFGLQIDGFVV